MHTAKLLHNIARVEQLANGSKWMRLCYNPIKYASAILIKKVFFPLIGQTKLVSTTIWCGKTMQLLLPAATDIYLTGGKSHCSEISLAKFLIHNLKKGETFWDIGAHYGYFATIASEIVGSNGRVIAIEASSTTFGILQNNIRNLSNAICYRYAISNTNTPITFYELPNKYSEYNSTDITQFENEVWFKKIKPEKQIVDALTLDQLLIATNHCIPQIMKIDVEGGEYAVIDGAKQLLEKHSPIIVMEFLNAKRNNLAHLKALELLNKLGYSSNTLDTNGNTHSVENIEDYLYKHKLDSDNIVFKKGKHF